MAGALIGVAVAALFGASAPQHLSPGGLDDAPGEASRAATVLQRRFGTGSPNIVVLVTATHGTVDDPSSATAGLELTRLLAAQPHVTNVTSYWSLGSVPSLRSADRSRAVVVGRIEGNQDQIIRSEPAVARAFTDPPPGVTVRLGGSAPTFHEVNQKVNDGLRTAELLALPIIGLLLAFVFGSAVAAALPLVIGAVSVIGTFLVLRLLAMVTDVSIFSVNLTTALGLGLAIDYSLFVVTRFREELAGGRSPFDAATRTISTAGRTVAGSALTVAVSLAALLVFPLVFLRSFAYAGIAVTALAGLAAVIVLPAVLVLLGHRVNALTVWKRSIRPAEEGFWYRTTTIVMRRPWPFATIALGVLLVLSSPFLHLHLGTADDRVLPPGNHTRQVDETVRRDLGDSELGAVTVVASRTSVVGNADARAAIVDRYAVGLSKLTGVARVDAATGMYFHGQKVPGPPGYTDRFSTPDGSGTWLSVVPTVEPFSVAGQHLALAVRRVRAPFPVLVGGLSAQLVDSTASLTSRLPLALGLIALVTFLLLFALFDSILVPLKALVLNVLSLSATFGPMVWIFQDGHLAKLLGVTATGTLLAPVPILFFCVAFGLSMDYEVFLLSRIKEEHDLGAANCDAVARGLGRTGRIVTAAAVLMSVVFLALVTSQISFIKLFGVGLTLAVLMDAFLIRGILVPALMRLAGEANWWAPAPLQRLRRPQRTTQ